jgi:hypothetical protein
MAGSHSIVLQVQRRVITWSALPLAALLFLCCMPTIAPAGQPAVSQVTVTDVIPRAFSVFWVSSEPSTCDLLVYDDQGEELLTDETVSESASHHPAEDVGVMKVRVMELEPDTTYYFQTVTTSKSDGKVTTYPPEPMPVQTEVSAGPVDNDLLAHRILKSDGVTPGQGALLIAEVDEGSYPISGWLGNAGNGELAPYVLVDLNNTYGRDSHENLELAGGEAITLTSIGGFMGFRTLTGIVPDEIGNGGTQELDPRPTNEQCTLLIDTDWLLKFDFNGDRKADILWRNKATGALRIWLMDGTMLTADAYPGTVALDWEIIQTGDFNGDSKADILWRNKTNGSLAIWLMNGTTATVVAYPATVELAWEIK